MLYNMNNKEFIADDENYRKRRFNSIIQIVTLELNEISSSETRWVSAICIFLKAIIRIETKSTPRSKIHLW